MDAIRVMADGPVRTVVLARPEKRNALTSAMLDALVAAFTAEPGPRERVTVLRAEGDVFCSGLDLRERVAAPPSDEAASPIERAVESVERYPLPVVAVVQGDAIAGGAELALHCDFVIASDTARFGMSLAQIGLAPTWLLTKKLLDVAGPVVTRELLLLGDPIPAPRLAELGVVARSVPADVVEETAQRIVDRLAANAPLSLRAMKATLVRAMAFRDAIAHGDLDDLVRAVRGSKDAREGIGARLERREARFTGR